MNKIKQAQQTLERLRKSNIDPTELGRNVSSIVVLADIMEGRSKHINETLRRAGQSKFADDIYIKNICHYSGFMQKSISRLLGMDIAEKLGDKCDFINEVIQIASDTKTEEQKLQILSTLKMIVK